MRKVIFICMVCLCATIQTNAQLPDTIVNMNTHKVDANLLFKKAKNQKTAAWILLGGGLGVAIAGMAIIGDEANKELTNDLGTIFTLGLYTAPPVKHSAAGPILAIAGTGALLGSIPLFIGSSKNKRKATLMLKNEAVFFNPQINNKEHLISLAIKINL